MLGTNVVMLTNDLSSVWFVFYFLVLPRLRGRSGLKDDETIPAVGY